MQPTQTTIQGNTITNKQGQSFNLTPGTSIIDLGREYKASNVDHSTAQSINTANPTDASRLTTATNITVPPPITAHTDSAGKALQSTVTSTAPQPTTDANGKPLIQPENNTDQKKGLLETFKGYISKLGTQGDVTNQLNIDEGVDAKKTQARQLENQYATTAKMYQDQIQTLQNQNPDGLDRAGINGKLSTLQRTANNDLANISIAMKNAEGNYTDAVALVKSKVDSMFGPIKDQLASTAQLYNLYQNDLSEGEKMQYQAQLAQQTDTAKSLEDAYSTTLQNAAQNHAPASVLASIDAALQKPGATQADIYAAAGKYGIDALKAAQTSKIYNDLNSSSTNTTNSNISIPTYTLKPGDDPATIAKTAGISVDQMKQANPQITDWNTIQPGVSINLPKTVGGSILAATGLSSLQMNYMTQGTSALTRLSSKDRQAVIASADAWAKEHGTDTATIQSQYKAYNDTLQKNIQRNNNTKIAEQELLGTITNLSTAADTKDFGRIKVANVAKLFAGEQLNDPATLKYAVHLNQLRTELAYYNAAVSGNSQADDKDFAEAERIIKNGVSTGSLTGFKDAITASTEKMGNVLQDSVDNSAKSVWGLFGVEDQYKPKAKPSEAPSGGSYQDFLKAIGQK